jgi:pimeloyl-ACP methyl ester carboxylesterase
MNVLDHIQAVLRVCLVGLTMLGLQSSSPPAPALVSFPTDDGGTVYAHEYGTGDRAVLLAHGGRFNKESWAPQAKVLVDAGFRVLAIDFRGYGQSRGPGQEDIFSAPLYKDVLAGVRYLRKHGAKTISIVCGSMGCAAGIAAIEAPDEIRRLVTLGTAPDGAVERLKVPTLIIIARDDANADGPRLPGVRQGYEKMMGPKELIVLDGSAHAQFLFTSDQAERVMKEILRFLSASS